MAPIQKWNFFNACIKRYEALLWEPEDPDYGAPLPSPYESSSANGYGATLTYVHFKNKVIHRAGTRSARLQPVRKA